MNEQIRLLQTEIRADLAIIAQAYDALNRLAIVLKQARRIEPLYARDIGRFLEFLDVLAETSV